MKTLALLVLIGSAGAPDGTPAEGPRYSASLEQAQSEARRREIPVLAFLYTGWCGWCRKLERETLTDARVVDRSRKDLVFVRLDAEDKAAGSELARRFAVGSYPTLLLLEPGGAELGRIGGFRAPEELLAEIDSRLGARRELEALIAREREAADDPQVLFDIAATLERRGQDAEAAKRYQRILAIPAERARRYRDLALWNLAQAATRLEDRKLAIVCYERLVTEFPQGGRAEPAHLQLGRLQQLAGDLEAALATFEAFVERFPDSSEAARTREQVDYLRSVLKRR